MSNDLATKNAWDIAVQEDEPVMPDRPKNWLDRVALLSGNSRAVAEAKAAPAQFQVGKNTFLDREFKALVVARRPHAIHIQGGSVVMESYDVNEDEFQTIQGLEMDPAVKKDSTQSAKAGQDFLLWIESIGQFAFIHLTSTALDNVGEFIGAMPAKGTPPTPVVISSSQRENKRMNFTWRVPRATADADLALNGPTVEALTHALDLFRNPRPQGRDEGEQQEETTAPAKKGRRKSSK